MNAKLIELYQSNWTNLSKDLNSILNNDELVQKPTNPLLLSINEEKYAESDIKVMIIGQETNGWGEHFSGNIEEIIEIYDDFYNSGYAINSYGGHFWNGFNRFCDVLQRKFEDKKIYYIWNNVIKIGAMGRNQNHPQSHIYQSELNNFNVLEKEIEIINPDIILFISGPNYDNAISNVLNGVEFQNLNSTFTARQISKLNFSKFENIFRTYHPNYLWRNNIDDYFNAIISEISL